MSSENRKKANEKKRRARQRRVRFQIAVLSVLAVVLLALIIIGIRRGYGDLSPRGTGESPKAISTTDGAADDSTVSSVSRKDNSLTEGLFVKKPKTINLTQAMLHSGDLIVVSSSHAYDFDANADSVDLVNIKANQIYPYPVDKEEFELARRALEPLDQMIRACDEALGTQVTAVSSAYRSEEYQQNVWDETVETNGEDYAKQYVAVPGYSEHHTGLAVDLGIIHSDGSYGSFSGSDNAAWIKENCARYGYVRRYAEDKVSITGISNEEWHFRYVGLPHARYMVDHNLCLEEYISYLRDNTSADAPLTITADDGRIYTVYFTNESEIEEPAGDYDISGNNIDGWIITQKQ